MTLPAGTQLGSFEILRALGAGGMGEVYLAQDRELNRQVAIKVLPPDVTSDPRRVARFEQEARAASALNHPNVCVIHALGRTEDGRRYIAMEYVEGETLRERLMRGRLPLREALYVAIQIASALTAAHAAGIVHRDIKPENVMVRRDRLVKVLDFGLAKLTAPSDAAAAQEATRTIHATEPGALVGTTRYMAPEQARGGAVDARTDVWALGVVLYELVTGRAPFTGETRSDVLASILEREPAPLTTFDPQVPRELQRIVGKTLRKDPDERYQVVKDLLLDLKSLEKELHASSSSAESSLAPASRRNPQLNKLRIGGGFLVLVALAGVLWWWTRASERPAVISAGTIDRPLIRLTFDAGLQTDVSFSPDGRSIAYASDREGNFDIWVQSVEGGNVRQVTKSPEQESQPSWSPDGRKIAFRSERNGGGLFVVPAQGGAERQLTSYGVHPIWSSDSREILFHVDEDSVRMQVVAAEGGSEPTELLTDFLHEGSWAWTAPHPDGRLSALGIHRAQGFGFFTVSRDGSTVTRSRIARDVPLGRDEQERRVERFRWNADGTTLYVDAVVHEVRNLWRVRVDPTTLEWQSADRLTTGAGDDVRAALSADGTRLAYTTVQPIRQLWAFTFDASAGRVLDEGVPVTPPDTIASSFDLSPDGTRVAYRVTRAGSGRVELWMTTLRTNTTEVIGEYAHSVIWSNDGKSLAYAVFRPNRPSPGEWALAARELGGPERLLKGWSTEDVLLPTGWAPDGRTILGSFINPLFVGVSRLALWRVISPAASRVERIVLEDRRRRLWQGRFAPNGQWVTFVAQPLDSPHVEMGIASADGPPRRSWRRLVPEHQWPDKPRWAPDGQTLYFISRHGASFFNLWGIRIDQKRGEPIGEPFRITQFDSPQFGIASEVEDIELGISANRLVMPMTTTTGNIWMLEAVDR